MLNAFRSIDRSWRLLLQALPRMLRQASSDWIDDNASRLGAAVAFYTLLSLAPIIVIAVADRLLHASSYTRPTMIIGWSRLAGCSETGLPLTVRIW